MIHYLNPVFSKNISRISSSTHFYQHFELLRRIVSGTYKNQTTSGTVVELRADMDGRRPQNRVSGDFFYYYAFSKGIIKIYQNSFVVQNLTVAVSKTKLHSQVQ